jgi:hypothetical protein
MAQILPKHRYDDIRRMVDPMLDDEAIPDELIETHLHLALAEAYIVSLDPLAETRTGTELEAVQDAIVMETAARISPSVPQFRQVNIAGHNVTLNYGETVEQRTQRLHDRAFYLIAGYLPSLLQMQVTAAPIFVTTVSGRRG